MIKRKMQRDNRSPSVVHGDQIMHVAVLGVFTNELHFQQMAGYVKMLRKRGLTTADFYIFFKKKNQMLSLEASKQDFAFRTADFNWVGKLTNEALRNAITKQYDVVIDLSRGKAVACDALLAKMKAKWKAGEYDPAREHLLDFMIDVKQDPDVKKLIQSLDQYLISFNKSNAA